MLSDGALLAIALAGLGTTVFVVLFFAGFFRGSKRVANAEEDDVEDAVLKAGGRRAAGGLAAMRKRKDKKKQGAAAPEAQAAPAPQEGDAQGVAEADAAEGNDPIEPRQMTKKELQKELKRREREEMRRFEEERREEQKKRADAKEEIYQKKREDEERFEQEKEEQERRLQLEREQQEQAEFDKWKDMFSIEQEGSKMAEDSEESQSLLQQFVDHIKTHKVILLEDLAAEFNLTTQDAIQRVEALQEADRITGIIDDRGKFIYVTEEEMDKVAKFIQRKGRLGLAELSRECNKLIRLEGENASANDSVDWLTELEQQQSEPLAPTVAAN